MPEKYTSNNVFMQMPAKKEIPKPFGAGYKKPDLTPVPPVEGDTKSAPDQSQPTPPTTSYHQPPPPKSPTAPERDFVRVPNSVNRDALPAGLFKGTSKKLYDALYQRTRGAIKPTREIQTKQSELMAWAGVSHNTLREHLRHLERVGLVLRKWELGDNSGATYEVFIPEELPLPTTSYHHTPATSTSVQNLVGASNQKMVGGGGRQVVIDSTTSVTPKTSFKTKEENTDDEAFAGFIELFRQITNELTGKTPNATDRDRWRELGELMVAELKIAAARTGQVSNVPAFLTEHLRRRLWKKSREEVERETKEAPTAPESGEGIDGSKCPDCGGSGWYYPTGLERGVAKCRHERLIDQPGRGVEP